MINNTSGKSVNKTSIIDSIKVNNIEYTDKKTISNLMCGYFASVGKNFSSNIPSSNINIKDYNKKISNSSKTTNSLEISRLIELLPNKKSSGWDGMSNVLLKSLKHVICKPLAILFN